MLAVAAIFPLGAFLPTLLTASRSTNIIVTALLLLIQLLISTYIFLWLFLAARGQKGHVRAKLSLAFRALPRAMTYAMALMAAVLLAASFLLLYLQGWWPALFLQGGSPIMLILLCAASVAGALIALALRRTGLAGGKRFGSFKNTLPSRALNLIYGAAARVATALAAAAYGFEIWVNRLVAHAAGVLPLLARLLDRLENGRLNRYLVIFLIGLFALLVLFVL